MENLEHKKLPSRFQHDDMCYLKMDNGKLLHSVIRGIKFTKSKVLYDVDTQVVPLHANENEEVIWSWCRIHGVSSDIVISIEEYDELKNQGLVPEFTHQDMVKFGNYLLSPERMAMKSVGPNHDSSNSVSHADFENWKEKELKKG